MAQKAKLFHDSRACTVILKADSPRECKRIGRIVPHFDDAAQDSVQYDVLKTGICAKFTQNEELKRKLLLTGQSVIAEVSSYNNIFAIGIAAEEAISVSPAERPGCNLLGKALMGIRAELRESLSVEDIANSLTVDSINRVLHNGGA